MDESGAEPIPPVVPVMTVAHLLGHEVGGWIDKWGPGVEGYEEGQPVALVSTRSCGACLECDAGFDNRVAHCAPL